MSVIGPVFHASALPQCTATVHILSRPPNCHRFLWILQFQCKSHGLTITQANLLWKNLQMSFKMDVSASRIIKWGLETQLYVEDSCKMGCFMWLNCIYSSRTNGISDREIVSCSQTRILARVWLCKTTADVASDSKSLSTFISVKGAASMAP